MTSNTAYLTTYDRRIVHKFDIDYNETTVLPQYNKAHICQGKIFTTIGLHTLFLFDFIKTEMLFKHEALFWPSVVNNQFEIEELLAPNRVFNILDGKSVQST